MTIQVAIQDRFAQMLAPLGDLRQAVVEPCTGARPRRLPPLAHPRLLHRLPGLSLRPLPQIFQEAHAYLY